MSEAGSGAAAAVRLTAAFVGCFDDLDGRVDRSGGLDGCGSGGGFRGARGRGCVAGAAVGSSSQGGGGIRDDFGGGVLGTARRRPGCDPSGVFVGIQLPPLLLARLGHPDDCSALGYSRIDRGGANGELF
jgi:hypothetical protein